MGQRSALATAGVRQGLFHLDAHDLDQSVTLSIIIFDNR